MSLRKHGEHEDHKIWIHQIAGATFFLRGLYQRLGDPPQAARAEKAGRMAQEQLSRVTVDASLRLHASSTRLRGIEQILGDQVAEQVAWKEALIGLLAIAIWAGVADAIEERTVPSTVCRNASKALEAALDAARVAFPEDSRKPLMTEMESIAVEGSLKGMAKLVGVLGDEGAAVLEVMETQVRRSVRKHLSQWG